LTRVQLDIVHC